MSETPITSVSIIFLNSRNELQSLTELSVEVLLTIEADKNRGLTVPFMMQDFKSVIKHGKETCLQRRVLTFNGNPAINCSIDIDFSRDYLNAQIRYFSSELPRRSYKMDCTLTDISEAKSGKKISLFHEFHYENLWLTVTQNWRPLCNFPCILPREDLYDFVNNDFRFLLMFKFVEGDFLEFQPAFKTLSSIFENETFADFTICVKKKEFKVHRAILATSSAVFEAMFSSEMKEQQENKMVINDIEADTVQEMLRFIYTGAVYNIMDNAEKLLIAADIYRLDNLKAYCGRQLAPTIKVDNAIELLMLADTFHEKHLRQCALDFINKNLKRILENKEHINLLYTRPDFAIEILLNHCLLE